MCLCVCVCINVYIVSHVSDIHCQHKYESWPVVEWCRSMEQQNSILVSFGDILGRVRLVVSCYGML